MRCPGCRREIAYTAMTCVCGWRATVSGPTAAPPATVPNPVKLPKREPLNPRMRAELDRLLAKFRQNAARQVERKLGQTESKEVIPGHGAHCFCEHCFPIRVNGGKAKKENAR